MGDTVHEREPELARHHNGVAVVADSRGDGRVPGVRRAVAVDDGEALGKGLRIRHRDAAVAGIDDELDVLLGVGVGRARMPCAHPVAVDLAHRVDIGRQEHRIAAGVGRGCIIRRSLGHGRGLGRLRAADRLLRGGVLLRRVGSLRLLSGLPVHGGLLAAMAVLPVRRVLRCRGGGGIGMRLRARQRRGYHQAAAQHQGHDEVEQLALRQAASACGGARTGNTSPAVSHGFAFAHP